MSTLAEFNAKLLGVPLPEVIQLAVSDETTPLTIGSNKVAFRMPFAMTLTDIRASVSVAPTSCNLVVDVGNTGGSILSIPLNIDDGTRTSVGSGTPASISTWSLTDDEEIHVDISQVGSTIAGAGLKIALIGYRTT